MELPPVDSYKTFVNEGHVYSYSDERLSKAKRYDMFNNVLYSDDVA